MQPDHFRPTPKKFKLDRFEEASIKDFAKSWGVLGTFRLEQDSRRNVAVAPTPLTLADETAREK